MKTFLLFLCLYCSEPLDRREQSVVVGQQFTDREGRRCVVVWMNFLTEWGQDRDDLMICVQGADGTAQGLYRWDRFWQMIEEVPQR